MNIGMYAAESELEQAVLIALENNTASLQQNKDGKNIGMIAAENELKQATLKALENSEASLQVDNKKYNILKYAKNNKLAKFLNKQNQNTLIREQNINLNQIYNLLQANLNAINNLENKVSYLFENLNQQLNKINKK